MSIPSVAISFLPTPNNYQESTSLLRFFETNIISELALQLFYKLLSHAESHLILTKSKHIS